MKTVNRKAGDVTIEEDKDVQVVAGVVDPKYLTLTKKPANQVGFKVIRTDQKGETPVTIKTAPTRTRVKRSEDTLLSLTFNLGLSDEELSEKVNDYGLVGFTVERTDKRVLVYRDEAAKALLADGTKVATVRLSDGVSAQILKPISENVDGSPAGISVVRVDFSVDAFPEMADVESYCVENGIDFSAARVENGETVKSLKCSDGDFGDTRSMQVDTGVVVVVARTDVTLVPPAFIEVVSETAYGSWGWGQLDFMATMADEEFCDDAYEANDMLDRVIRNILFYSSLPIAVRKELVSRATSQYAEYINTLLDALPTKVLIATRNETSKGNEMSKNTEEQKAAATPTEPAATTEVITRGDVAAIVADAMAPLMAKIDAMATPVVRNDEGSGAEDAPAAAEEQAAGAEGTEVVAQVTRSVDELVNVVKTLTERVASIEGTTIVRSDNGDPSQNKDAPTAKRSDDVFIGVLGGNKAAE